MDDTHVKWREEPTNTKFLQEELLFAAALGGERTHSARRHDKRKASKRAARAREEERMQDKEATGLDDEEEMVGAKRARLAQSDCGTCPACSKTTFHTSYNLLQHLLFKMDHVHVEWRADPTNAKDLQEAEVTSRAAACVRRKEREADAMLRRDVGDATGATEVVDEKAFMARFLAFRQARSYHLHAPPARGATCSCDLPPRAACTCRCVPTTGQQPTAHPHCTCAQHVEFVLEVLPSKTTKAKPWKLSVRREKLCDDVVGHFSSFTKQKLFQRTSVTFIDKHGAEEDGVDLGGLTAEMYSSFFREVVLRDLGLFEGVADDTGGSSIGLLPKPDAPTGALQAVGRAICKCVFDDQPIGSGLAPSSSST